MLLLMLIRISLATENWMRTVAVLVGNSMRGIVTKIVAVMFRGMCPEHWRQ
jgi:hypothetical protein